jgi:hypothetical protein
MKRLIGLDRFRYTTAALIGIAAMALTAITSIALARQQAPKITPPAR